MPGTYSCSSDKLGVFQIHIENPDYVAIKTGLRQMASRLEAELNAANQWSALSENRKIEGVPPVLEKAADSLESAVKELRKAAEMIVDIQEEHHEH